MSNKRGFTTDVVFYEQPTHVKKLALGVKKSHVLFEGIAPFQFLRNWFYGDLQNFSNVIVKSTLLEDGTTKAIIIKNKNVIKPNEFRNILNNKYVIIANVTCSMFLSYKLLKFAKKIIW